MEHDQVLVKIIYNRMDDLSKCRKNYKQVVPEVPCDSVIECPLISNEDTQEESSIGTLSEQLEQEEKRILSCSLDVYKGNVTQTANSLGISRKGLQLKMIKYNLRIL